MLTSRFTRRLIQVFLIMAILFFCGFYYMVITKEIIPAFKKNTPENAGATVQYSIAAIKIYTNKHYKKEDLDVSHQYGFSLIAKDDSIPYASSSISNGIAPTPGLKQFSSDETPVIPGNKANSSFYLAYVKDGEAVFSYFPEFRFTDYQPKDIKEYISKQVEVKQVSTDGKMMIYAMLHFQYGN